MTTFEDFWRVYPRKVGKLAAKREWERLKPDAETKDQMEAALTWQIEQWRDPQFVPHPRTWLHQGRWMDEPVARVQPASRWDYDAWVCPHKEHCGHPRTCQMKTMLGKP